MTKKITSIAILLLLPLSIAAHAVQTADCGENMVDLKNKLRSKFGHVFADPNYAAKFVGTWSGYTTFDIDSRQNFTLRGDAIKICPQEDKSFYFFKIEDPTTSGSFKLNSTGSAAVLYNGTGIVSMAEGNYTHTTEIARYTR